MNALGEIFASIFAALGPMFAVALEWAPWFYGGLAIGVVATAAVIFGLSIVRAPVLEGYYSEADTRDGRQEPPTR